MAFTLASPVELTEEIKKSRFLIRAFPLSEVTQFDSYLANIRQQEAASHHCWAWKIGSNYRFSDDGEPKGTAGKPILNAIEGKDCDKIAIIITRWFGGIHLGTGGLVRAYGGGAARLLQQAELIKIIAKTQCRFHTSFSKWPIIEAALFQFAATIESQSFNDKGVEVTLTLPLDKAENIYIFLRDLSRGQIEPKWTDA